MEIVLNYLDYLRPPDPDEEPRLDPPLEPDEELLPEEPDELPLDPEEELLEGV